MVADDTVDGGKTEAGALPYRLGGVEGLEDLGQYLARDTHTGIRHHDHRIGRRALGPVGIECVGTAAMCRDGYRATPIAHGIARIVH